MDRCLFLNPEREGLICKASLTNMSPSVFEIDIYCATAEHHRCPVLLAHCLREGKNAARKPHETKDTGC